MKAVVAAFNQEKALVGAFSVIVKTGCGTNGSFYSTNLDGNILVINVNKLLPNCLTFVAVNHNFSVAVPGALVVRLVRGQDRGKEVYIADNTS